jgi:NAD(P)-dependent dehydrogenase (short-subunit alcohol dehydrogenase family)
MTTQKVAVVTGAGSGLGRLIALALAAKGWRVAAAGRRPGALAETARLAEAGAVLPVPTDVTDADSVAALFAVAGERFGRLDLLVNNAGTGAPPGAVDEVSPDGWQSIVAVNLTGSYLCAHHAVAMMKAQRPMGGRIINNGSISAHSPRPRSVGYTVTKHAITGLTKSISLDGRAYNIACGQIDIGNANTAMTEPMASGVPQADGSIKPEPTFNPKLAADAVLFMAELPLDANIQFLTITATSMPFIGRGLPNLSPHRICSPLHSGAAARRQRPVPGGNRDISAVHRPLLTSTSPRTDRRGWRRLAAYAASSPRPEPFIGRG